MQKVSHLGRYETHYGTDIKVEIYFNLIHVIVKMKIPAVHSEQARVALIVGPELAAELDDGAGPVGHTVVGPRREVELFDVSVLVSLQDRWICNFSIG